MPNGEDKLLNFVPKIFDKKTNKWQPLYIPPDATDKVQGDVKLSDLTNSTLNATEGMTAATPKAVKDVNDNANTKLSKVDSNSQTVQGEVVFSSLVTGNGGFKGNLTGNASSANVLTPGRSINVRSGTSGTPGSAKFTGSSDITITIPTLDATTLKGLVPLTSIPQGSLERLVKVANEEARFQLTTEEVQLGDSVLQTDTGVMYIVVNENNLNSFNGYQEYKAATALNSLEADHATNADNAIEANHAVNADNATNATHADNATNSNSATQATQDSLGQNISENYIKGLSIEGKNLTYTKGNNSSEILLIQEASEDIPGFMSIEDKIKLNQIDLNNLIWGTF